jgi:hypothetical protein
MPPQISRYTCNPTDSHTPSSLNGAASQASTPIRYTRGHPHPHPVKSPGDTQVTYDKPSSSSCSSAAVPQPPQKPGLHTLRKPRDSGLSFASMTWERPLKREAKSLSYPTRGRPKPAQSRHRARKKGGNFNGTRVRKASL